MSMRHKNHPCILALSDIHSAPFPSFNLKRPMGRYFITQFSRKQNMTIKHIFITSLLSIALTAPAMAEEPASTKKVDTSELAAPLIKLIPAFKKVREELKLNEEQTKAIDAWMSAAPAKKQELKENIFSPLYLQNQKKRG